jgi:hypothetical protein
MKYLVLTLVGAAIVLTLASCSGQSPEEHPMDTNGKATEQFNQLMQRPDIDQATARYDEMYTKVRSELTASFPALKWIQSDNVLRSGCGADFSAIDVGARSDAEERGLPNWKADGNLPDAQWEQAVTIVRHVAQSYAFDTGQLTVNRPNDHEVVFRDQYRAELNFGSAVNTTLLLRTGCHLTAEAKKRGQLAPTPSY